MSQQKDFNFTVGGLTDREGAKAIAKKLFDQYKSDSNTELQQNDMSQMMVDAYKCMQKGFNPTKDDESSYFSVLDRNSDGRVTLQDLEQLAIKYLVGDGNLGSYEQVKTTVTNSNKQENQIALHKRKNSSSSLSSSSSNQKSSNQNSTSTKTVTIQKRQVTQTVTKTVNGESQSFTQSQQQQAITSQNSNNDNNNKIEQKKYSPFVEKKLDVARRLFKKFDTDNSGTITEEEVAPLLQATYKNMQIDYKPTQDDIQEWLKMTDLDGDGSVTLEEYEKVIIQSLQNAGINLDE